MKICFELLAGRDGHSPTKQDIERNIEAQERAIQGKLNVGDFVSLSDTKSILVGIQKELPM